VITYRISKFKEKKEKKKKITKVYYKELRSLKVDGQGGWRNVEIGAEVSVDAVSISNSVADNALQMAKSYVRSRLDKEVEGEEPKTAKDKLIRARRDIKKAIENLHSDMPF